LPTAKPGAAGRIQSLTTRLAVALALLLLAGGAAVALGALAYGRHAAQEAYDRLLVGAANAIAGGISLRDGTVAVNLPISAFELLALATEDRVVYAVIDPEGQVVTGYEGVDPAAPDARSSFHEGKFAGEPIRLATVRRRFAERTFSGTVTVVVGQTTRARAELAGEITRGALAVAGFVGLLMSGLAVFAVRSALRPLRRIEGVLAARSPRDLTPIDVAVPREIDGLVEGINRFMARLDRQMTAMRNLIADASHQIRTPIAALRAQADLAGEETDPARLRAIVARIHGRAVSLGRLTDQMLNHALIIHRADAAPLERIDLRTVAIRVVEESDHDLLADDAVLRLDLPEEPVWCDGDALSLGEACKNLVMNAFRHGVPPVTLVVCDGAAPMIAVRDRGPGIPEAHWPDAATRYARMTGVSPESAGLGLAIVAAVAQAHGGTLAFARAGEGFEARLVLSAVTG
jgi:two-component system, OmpR family, sensor histidine kinase TctE